VTASTSRTDVDEDSVIMVFAERAGTHWNTVTLELLEDAQALAQRTKWKVVAVVFCNPSTVSDADCQELAAHGANEVILLESAEFCTPQGPFQYRSTLAEYVKQASPRMLLCPSTPLWVNCLGQLAPTLNGILVSDCISFKLMADGKLELTRSFWNNKMQSTMLLPADRTWCICLRPGVAGVGRANAARKAVVRRQAVSVPADEHVQTVQLLPPRPSEIDLVEADRIIAGGRGVQGPEGFVQLEKLAELLEAAVGASRVAVDLGWVPYARQVGQTGKTVKPRLYIAIGISGASQHVDGMRESEVIVAINHDRDANIFKLAHFGAVGDAGAIVQALIDALQPSLATSQAAATKA
jgi:electron transfer flavoprotein alpha subunit